MAKFTNLFIGYNPEEDFRILICAADEQDASEYAEQYRIDSHMDGKFEISEPTSGIDEIHFDCDYVIC